MNLDAHIRGQKDTIDWVVGVSEFCGLIDNISRALPNSYSVVLSTGPFFSKKYDFHLSIQARRLTWLIGPLLFCYLLPRTRGFIYLWSSGFLDSDDGREFEFCLLKRLKKTVVCYFIGNDIRSPRLALAQAKELNIEVTSHYYHVLNPERLTETYEKTKRRLAQVADRHADVIVNAQKDQISYLERPTLPFLYFVDDEAIVCETEKFSSLETIRIVHAPSNPVVKGTQIVRAAIYALKEEGYSIDYIELIGVSNQEVQVALSDAHICLNEFYSLVPGVFGVEALSSLCVLLVSADESLEPDLPAGSNEAWVVTRPHQLYRNLKRLLDHPQDLEGQAFKGLKWVQENAAYSVTSQRFQSYLSQIAN